MRKFIQVPIPEKLYNVVLEICKLEPGVETDRLLPEDMIERNLSVRLREILEQYLSDKQATEAAKQVLYAYSDYAREKRNEFNKKYHNHKEEDK